MAIIGIVAALTIPTLISNYQKNQYQTQLKKAQSTLSQAFAMMKANGENVLEGDINGDGSIDASDASLVLQDYYSEMDILLKYFKGTRKTLDNVYTVYDICGEKLTDSFYSSKNKKTGNISPNKTGFFTADGMFIYYIGAQTHSGARLVPKDYTRIVAVDINGPFKKPNRDGFDIFTFFITDKASVIPAGAFMGDKFPVENLYSNSLNNGIGLSYTYSALTGKNPDGTDYWKNTKYWCE